MEKRSFIRMKYTHAFILFWVGYFATIGLTDHISLVLAAVAIRAGVYAGYAMFMAIYVGAVALSCLMMCWVMRGYRVFWSAGRHQAEAFDRVIRTHTKH